MHIVTVLAIAFTTLLVTDGSADVPVNDGSFELGPPPNSAWTEGSNTPLCEWIVDSGTLTTVFGTVAHDGNWAYWAGGYCPVPEASIDSVSQDVNVPSDAIELSFCYQVRRGDPDDDGLDIAYISINDAPIWTIPMSFGNDNGPVWVNDSVDVSAFAGSTVDLTVGNFAVAVSGNCLFDNFQWEIQVVPVENKTWGAIKALYQQE